MAGDGAQGVTAVVLTRDEEDHLPDCLASLAWVGRVLVVDSGSRDRTVAIAAERGADVLEHPFENYSHQRQFALSQARSPWVLFVDADERIPDRLATEISQAVALDNASAYWIPRSNVFWGHRMRGGGWWPDHQLRLLRVDRCRFDPQRTVHEVAEVVGRTGHLTTPMVHLNYKDLHEFMVKQRLYALLEARRRRAAGDTVHLHNLVLQPVREFWRRYVSLSGWRDGGTGILLCSLMAWYELVTLRGVRR